MKSTAHAAPDDCVKRDSRSLRDGAFLMRMNVNTTGDQHRVAKKSSVKANQLSVR